MAVSDSVFMHTAPALTSLKPADLPAPLQATFEVLRACTREDVDSRRLAEFAKSAPILSAELLRVVNTRLFGIAHEITSVRHAVSLLGIRALRNIVFCLMVREAAHTHAIPAFEITLFWEDSLRRAVTARWLGAQLGLDRDECFTAGLLQDFGLLIPLYLNPQYGDEFISLQTLDPAELLGIINNEICETSVRGFFRDHDRRQL